MIRYRIYQSPPGGAVDESVAVGDTDGLSFVTAPLAAGASYTFAVHPYDTATGLADRSADSRVTVRLTAAGADAAPLPPAPLGLTARPLAGGSVRASWAYPPAARPVGFRVYAWSAAGPPSYAAPAATVAAAPGRSSYSADLAGLTPGTPYRVAVRAYNAAGAEENAASAAVTPAAAGPDPVVGLTATVSA